MTPEERADITKRCEQQVGLQAGPCSHIWNTVVAPLLDALDAMEAQYDECAKNAEAIEKSLRRRYKELEKERDRWEIRAETAIKTATAKVDEWQQRAEAAEQQRDVLGHESLSLVGELAVAITEKEAAEAKIDECRREMEPFEGLQPFIAILKGES